MKRPLNPFTKRHEQAIFDRAVEARIPKRCRYRLMRLVERWGQQHDPDWGQWSMLPGLYERLTEIYGAPSLWAMDPDFSEARREVNNVEAFVLGCYPTEVFDVIEVFHHMLGDKEAEGFRQEANSVLEQEGVPWCLVHGEMLRLDADFLKLRLTGRTFDLLRSHGFEGPLEEFQEALNESSAGNAEGGIVAAAKSFESMMKAVLGRSDGNANALVRGLVEAGLFDDLPEDVPGALGSSVLMALPFLGNRLGRHGQGADVRDVNSDYAELAIGLAATFITLLVRRHQARMEPPRAPRQPEPPDFGPDDAPF